MCLTSTETARLIRDGERVWRWGKREIIYISLHCYHQNDSSIKMGSDERHLNAILLIMGDKVTISQCPQINLFEEKGEQRRNLLTSLTSYR